MRLRWRHLVAAALALLALDLLVGALLGPPNYREAVEQVAREAEQAVSGHDQEQPLPARPTGREGCQRDPARLPPPPPGSDGRPGRYYHTCGGLILSSDGQEVQITGVNWFGMETETYAPHGLWSRNWKAVLDQIVELGFNTIRLPYSNAVLRDGQMPQGINYELNPDLQGKTALQVMDTLIAGARERGLKVILDRHRPTPERQSELWYTDEVSEEQWIAEWVMLARRYHGDDTVIGVDLHNEPRGPATWGSGDPETDWRLAAEKAGNAILDANPYLLIFVQGVERHGDDWYWWGGNLQGVREHPVRLKVPGRLVYSPHVYGPGVFEQGWFKARDFPNNLPQVWDSHWGFIARKDLAPVVLGEFGGRSVGGDAEGQWQRALMDYLKRHGIGWINWSLNPNSSDTGGLLGEDWRKIVEEKARLYRANAAAPLDVGSAGVFGSPEGRLLVRAQNTSLDEQTNTIGFVAHVVNDGPDPIKLSELELRYWFTPGQLGDRKQEAVVDYATMGEGSVKAEVEPPNAQGLAFVRVRFSNGAGELEPYTSSGDIMVRIHKSDWSSYRQSNDFSFKPDDQLGDWERVTLYRDGERVWGEEPEA